MEAQAARWKPAGRRWRHALESRRVLAPLLIAPAVVFMALVVGVPFGWAIYLSFTDAVGGSLTGHWVGFDNFAHAWQDENFRRALRNTLIFTLASQAIVVVGAAVLSAFLVRDFRGKWIIRFLVVLPWAAPVVLSTIAWLWIFDSLYSVLNWTLARLHLDHALVWLLGAVHLETGAQVPLQWLGRPNLALIAITVVHAWRILPFAVVIFIAGRASIPNEVEDASKIDGATGVKKLWYVDLPLQLPIALVAVLFGIVFTAVDFAVVYLLTHGGPFNSTQVLPTWAYAVGIDWARSARVRPSRCSCSRCSCSSASGCCSSHGGRRSADDEAPDAHDLPRRHPVRDLPRVPVPLRARDDVQDEPRPGERRALPLHVQRPRRQPPLGLLELRHVRARPVPLRGDELPDLALEHPDRRRGGRRHHIAPRPPAGYALARLAGGWGQSAGVAIFLVYLIPPTLLFLPLSRLVTQLDLKDSLWALILVYPSFTVPFATWLLMGFFKTIPQELEEAALMDGASRLKALFLIILPISLPGILTVVIFAFSLCVNEFIYAFTFISSSEQRTVSAGIPNDLIRGDVFFWQSLMAATLIPAIPIALLYNAFLDRFIKGFTGGAFR